MHEFIQALRELRFPIVVLAAAAIVLQTLVAGIATGHAASRLASGDAGAAILCHGDGTDEGAPAAQIIHQCCTFGTSAGPSAAPPELVSLGALSTRQADRLLAPSHDLQRLARAIRAGPSQAPPVVS